MWVYSGGSVHGSGGSCSGAHDKKMVSDSSDVLVKNETRLHGFMASGFCQSGPKTQQM